MASRYVWAIVAVASILWLTSLSRTPAGARLSAAILLAGCVAGAAYWAARSRVVLLPRRPTRGVKPVTDLYAERVAAMSVEEARERARRLLGERYSTETTPDPNPPGVPGQAPADDGGWVDELHPTVRDLLLRHPLIRSAVGPEYVSLSDVKPFELPGNPVLAFGTHAAAAGGRYLRLGADADGDPLLARPGEQAVYVLRKSLSGQNRYWMSEYPSIFHWLLRQNPDPGVSL